LVRLDRHLSEYLVFQTFWVLFKSTFSASGWDRLAGVDTGSMLDAWGMLPGSVLKPERNKRSHLSNVLSRNEVDRDYPYNRKLFKRIAHGWYQINPRLAIRRRAQGVESWHPVLEALNLRLVHEFAHPDQWGVSQALWRSRADTELPTPVAAEAWEARERDIREAKRTEVLAIEARRRAAEEARRRQAGSRANPEAQPPRWGTPEAKAAAREELRRRIEAQRNADKIGKR
jgi:hypothetical protein